MDIKHIHFVGIGGIGISGLARYMHSQGVEISGSDVAVGVSTKYLESLGIKVNIPHSRFNVENPSLVVHSAIIKSDNIELQEARAKNIPVLSRSEALKIILGQKRVFSVCGAHGKSSTTAMLSAILGDYGAIIGAESKEFGSNVRAKKSENIVFEADESDGSFLNSNPHCAIVTNAEQEHMEYYNYDTERFYNAYRGFLEKAKIRVINAQDEFLSTLTLPARRLYPSNDIKNIEQYLDCGEPYSAFDLWHSGEFLGRFSVWGFGFHTISNASLAILAALDELEIPQIRENLKNYIGIKKRFDVVCKGNICKDNAANGTSGGCIIIDDYAHHPTEINSTMDSILKYAEILSLERVSIVWQPHKYSRTITNIDAFVDSFKRVKNRLHRLVILPVWGAYENPVDIDFSGYFGFLKPIFADEVVRNGDTLRVVRDRETLEVLDSGIIVGFGAGDITYQLRGKV